MVSIKTYSKYMSLNSGIRQGYLLSLLLSNVIQKFQPVRQKIEGKGIQKQKPKVLFARDCDSASSSQLLVSQEIERMEDWKRNTICKRLSIFKKFQKNSQINQYNNKHQQSCWIQTLIATECNKKLVAVGMPRK